MRELLRNRNARIYLPGQILSSFGDSALWLAMALWARMLTGSTSQAGFVTVCLTLGLLFTPLSGVLIDRMRRRRLLITVNLAVGAFVLLLLLVHGRGQVWLIYLVMLGYGLSSGVLAAAQSALLKTMVPKELLGDANGILQTAQQGLKLLAPLMGAGMLAAFGATPVIITDSVTFFVAAGSLLCLRVDEVKPEPSGEPRLRAMTAGVRFIRRTPRLRQLTVTAIMVVAGFGLIQTNMIAIVTQGLHRPVALTGVLSSTIAVGGIITGALSATVMRRIGPVRLYVAGMLCALLATCLEMTTLLPVIILGCVLEGASLPWVSVSLSTAFQQRTPSELMGRTSAALSAALSVPQATATAVGAALIAVVNYRFLLGTTALIMLAGVVFLLTRPDDRTDPAAESTESGRTAGVVAEHS